MALVLTRPTTVETTKGITFALAELNTQTIGAETITIRSVPTYTVTLSGNLTLAAETISVNATTVDLDAGTKLTFGSTTVQVAVYTPSGSTSISILPSPGTAASSTVATTKAWRFVNGCFNATVQPQIKNVETTNYLSGIGMEQVTTGNSKTMQLEFNLVYGDKGGYVLRKIAYDKTYVGREFYFRLEFPSGEAHEGSALLTSASPTQAVQDKRSFQCEAQIQGDSYIYFPATELTITA